jgi:hypothetical protein
MNVTIIRTSGAQEQQTIRADTDQAAFAGIAHLIGAKTLDTVNLRDGRVMIVDDNGYETETITHGPGQVELRPTKARKPVNAEATKLYHDICRPGTTHQIVGDVAIVRDEDFA